MTAKVDSGCVSRIVGTVPPQSAATANTSLPCNDKHHALAEYALAGMDDRLRAAKHLCDLPEKDDMQQFIDKRLREVGE